MSNPLDDQKPALAALEVTLMAEGYMPGEEVPADVMERIRKELGLDA